MKPNYLIIAFLFLFDLNVFSQSDYQKGYVQITETDTLYGLINYKSDESNNKVCYFKKEEGAEIQKFLPGKIFGYRFLEGKYYVSKEVTNKNETATIFVECLFKGKVSLFYYNDYHDHYLLQKEGLPMNEISYDDDIYNIDGKLYSRDHNNLINRGMIKYYLQDCPEIFNAIDELKSPSHSELIGLIKKYHDLKCPNDVCIIYKKKLPGIKIYIQPVCGLIQYNKNYVNYSNPDNYGQFGILTYFWMPLVNERLFFKTGILYSKIKEVDDTEHPDRFDRSTYFKVPLQFQYIFMKHCISPTFGGGINLITSHRSPFALYTALNAGLNIKLNERFNILLLADMDYVGLCFFIPTIKNRVSHSFSLGLTMKL